MANIGLMFEGTLKIIDAKNIVITSDMHIERVDSQLNNSPSFVKHWLKIF